LPLRCAHGQTYCNHHQSHSVIADLQMRIYAAFYLPLIRPKKPLVYFLVVSWTMDTTLKKTVAFHEGIFMALSWSTIFISIVHGYVQELKSPNRHNKYRRIPVEMRACS
jgi:hypothetical protein